MKSFILALPVLVLIAAGCNSSQPVSSQTPVVTPAAQTATVTPTSTPSPMPSPTVALGAMPSMTFTLTPSADGSGEQDLNLFANGKKVATVANQEPGDYNSTSGVVQFEAGNSQEVLFVVTPEIGIGDLAYNGIVDMLNLQNDTVTTLANPATAGLDWTPNLQYIAYSSTAKGTQYGATTYTLNILNTATKSDETVALPGVPASLNGQLPYVGDIKFSPDQSKVAVVQGYYGNDGASAWTRRQSSLLTWPAKPSPPTSKITPATYIFLGGRITLT